MALLARSSNLMATAARPTSAARMIAPRRTVRVQAAKKLPEIDIDTEAITAKANEVASSTATFIKVSVDLRQCMCICARSPQVAHPRRNTEPWGRSGCMRSGPARARARGVGFSKKGADGWEDCRLLAPALYLSIPPPR